MTTMPDRARALLEEFASWGINRFSVKWDTAYKREMLDLLDDWGFGMNIYNVPDLQSFLRAVLMQPRSVTSDFNFPKWRIYGRGLGEGDRHHGYPRQSAPALMCLTC